MKFMASSPIKRWDSVYLTKRGRVTRRKTQCHFGVALESAAKAGDVIHVCVTLRSQIPEAQP